MYSLPSMKHRSQCVGRRSRPTSPAAKLIRIKLRFQRGENLFPHYGFKYLCYAWKKRNWSEVRKGDGVDWRRSSNNSIVFNHSKSVCTIVGRNYHKPKVTVQNVYGNALISAFPLVRHTFTGTLFPYKNIYGNVVPTRSRATTPLLIGMVPLQLWCFLHLPISVQIAINSGEGCTLCENFMIDGLG